MTISARIEMMIPTMMKPTPRVPLAITATAITTAGLKLINNKKINCILGLDKTDKLITKQNQIYK